MTTHYSYCDFHLGDNIVHLHFLRKLALRYPQHRFVHFLNGCYEAQLRCVVKDIPTIEICWLVEGRPGYPSHAKWIGHTPPPRNDCRNVWKNADGYWENHPLKNDFSRFYIRWFDKLAKEMGLESPLKTERDLLFDYPALLEPAWEGIKPFDYLVLNSRPCSGQFLAYDRVEYFDPLLEQLVDSGKRVAATQVSEVAGVHYTPEHGNLTLTQIGNLSLRCKNIISVATGPMWPTLNVWAKPEKRLICLDCPERNIIDPNAIYCRSLGEVERCLGL